MKWGSGQSPDGMRKSRAVLQSCSRKVREEGRGEGVKGRGGKGRVRRCWLLVAGSVRSGVGVLGVENPQSKA